MVSSNWFRLALAFGLGLILLVVSCAPAAEPTIAPTTAPPTPTSPPPTTAPTLAPGVTPTATPTAAPVTIATPRPPTPTPAPAVVQPRRGGTLISTALGIFGMASWEECCSEYAKMINDSVLEYIPSNKFIGGDEEIGSRMAYEWSVSKDGLSWTFKLEDGMKAALPKAVTGGYDGAVDTGFEAVNCEDVAWSIMTIRSGEGLRRTMRGRTFVPVTGVECPDPLTVVVKTKWPYAALPGMLAAAINDIKPKDFWKDRLKDIPIWVVGSGPWKLERVLPGELQTFIPNRYYHRKAADGKPYPYLDRVEFRDIPYTACSAALRTGRVHMCGGGGASHYNQADTLFKEAPHLEFLGPFRAEDNPEWGAKGFLPNNAIFLMAHHGKAPWNNVKLREALSLALDRRTLCDIGIEKWCVPGGFIYVVGTPWNLPKDQVQSYPGYNISTVDQNVAKARQILTDLGYKLYPDSKALTIDLPAWGFTGDFTQGPTIEMLRRAGFNPNYYIPEFQRILSQVVAGEFEVVAWDQLVTQPDPNQICYEHYFTGSDRNYGRYGSATADELCHKMGQELDKTKRIALAHQFHKLILDEHARATFLWRGGALAQSPNVKGRRISSNYGSSMNRMEDWWLAK
ncbi:MAG: hypothetical protein HY685_07190 [Chloroflexi bacterium]|nr:hypothetical protein [Chloroflexota bacterium]